jgi:hypothetical protein
MGKAKHRRSHRRHASRLTDPSFQGSIFKIHGQLDYSRFQSDLEPIFTDEFPRSSQKTASHLAAKVGNCRQRLAVIPGIFFTNEDFREIAIRAFLEKYSGNETSVPAFNVSAGFITGFKLRNGFSSRSCHIKRRTPVVSAEMKG